MNTLKKIINLTGKNILFTTYHRNSDGTTVPKHHKLPAQAITNLPKAGKDVICGYVCPVSTSQDGKIELALPVNSEVSHGKPKNLPPERKNTLFIVPAEVFDPAKAHGRKDLLTTVGLQYERGNSIRVMGFVCSGEELTNE